MVDNLLFLTQLVYFSTSFSVIRKFRIVKISFNSPSSNMNLMFYINIYNQFFAIVENVPPFACIYTRKRRFGMCQARIAPKGESACALATHTYKSSSYYFFISRLSVCPSKGFSKASATDDFDLLILRPVYILIMYGVLLVPSPVTLVVDLREIEGRTLLVPDMSKSM